MKKSNKPGGTPLKQAPDMMKELNKTGGRYIPIWVEEAPELDLPERQVRRESPKSGKRRTKNGKNN
mgnify:CR=1 FL=1